MILVLSSFLMKQHILSVKDLNQLLHETVGIALLTNNLVCHLQSAMQ
jgi:hypothetical protein